jgi:hypothetical protein
MLANLAGILIINIVLPLKGKNKSSPHFQKMEKRVSLLINILYKTIDLVA